MNRRFSRLVMLLVLSLLQVTVAGWAEEAPDGSAGPNTEELRKQAEQGDAQAQFSLGACYADGKGVDFDVKEAVKWYARAAEQGHAHAQSTLGMYYEIGFIMAKDQKEAVKWYTRAAEQGDALGQVNLGLCYAKGEGVAKDQKEAVKWYTRAAEQGYAYAQFSLALCYANGEGVAKDPKEAVKWYTRAAEQGYAEAQNNLGVCYYAGEGVPKDQKEAVKWYTSAAEQGNAGAQYNLGLRYANGEGVPKDQKAAVKWYTRAAEQGDALAQNNLGVCYALGEGVAKDSIRAYMWFNLAAVEDPKAVRSRELAAQEMTPAQIAEAQRLSAAFVPKVEGAGGASPSPSSDSVPAAPDMAAPPKGTGTAFAITTDGYLVTAAHVVAGAARVVVYAGGQLYSATVVAQDAVNDVAVLKAEGVFSPVRLVSSGSLTLGADLFTVGFPDVQVQGTAPKLTKGSVSGLLGPGDDPRYFQLSNPIQPGNSGGSVANVKGEVIGVLVGMLDLMKTIERTGQAPQNVNFALKSSYVLPLLETVPGLSAQIGKVKSPGGDAYQAVTAATVMVVVY